MRTNTWRMAAAVAVLMIAGACGNSSDGSGASGGRPKLPTGPSGATGGATPALASEAVADSSTRSMMPFRAVEYRLADGAKAPATTAAAYEVKPASGDLASKVAKALDVDTRAIFVAPGDMAWSYSGSEGKGGTGGGTVSSSGTVVACDTDGDCPELTTPPTVPGVPSAGGAEKRVKSILDDLGVSSDGKFEAFGQDGYSRTVVFSPAVDGVAVVGMESAFTFGEAGRLQYANGFVATMAKVGDYPLVGMDVALKRLQEGFGSGAVRTMGAPTMGVAEDTLTDGPPSDPDTTDPGTESCAKGETCSVTPSPPTGPACAKGETCAIAPLPPTDEPTMTIEPQPEPPVPLDPQIVEITGADLVLQVVATGCPGDAVYLVPTFELQPGPAGNVTAVADDALAVTDASIPAEPCSGPTPPDVPMGKPEPAPAPATGREPAKP